MVRKKGGAFAANPFGRPRSPSQGFVHQLLCTMATTAAADRGLILLQKGRAFTPIAAVGRGARRALAVDDELSVSAPSLSILNRVARARRAVRGDIVPSGRSRARSGHTLFFPLMHARKVVAVLYMERAGASSRFTTAQFRKVALLAPQLGTVLRLVDEHHREVQALEARVNPPFFHNVLSIIAQLATADGAKAEEAILMLSRLYRYVLSSSADRIVTLEQELAASRDYLALEHYRLGDRMRTEVVVDGQLDRIHVPCLLLHVLIEGSVSYGIAPKVGGGRLKVSVFVSAEQCVLRVEDDGVDWVERGREVGARLRSIKQRLTLHYPRRHSLLIDKSSGLTVEVRIQRYGSRDRRRPALEARRQPRALRSQEKDNTHG
jgi:LytS/YehU family sensor histidine kinase